MASSRKYHVSPFKPVRVRPSGGGKLMSNVSSDSAGINNYTVKRDWRRVLDREVRAEGYEYFWPNATIPMGNQPFPNAPHTSEPITLIAEAIQPNGRRAVVCATPTTIYRYFALDNGAYYTGDGTPDAYYAESGPDTPYYDDNPGVWIVIGSGFSPEAQRWESLSINGYLVLNNGVDLPMTYRVEEFAVKPIYELRENGIASVGNIAAFDTLLLVADVSEIDASKLVEIMTPIPSGVGGDQIGSIQPNRQLATLASNSVTVTGGTPFSLGVVGFTIQFVNGQSRTITGFTNPTMVTVDGDNANLPPLQFSLISPGDIDYTVFTTAPVFDATMVGRVMVWPDGTVRTITKYLTTQSVVTDSNGPIALSSFVFKNPAAYAPFTDQNFINRIQYRLANSAADEPRRWAAIAPASITAGSINLKFDYPVLSFASGQQLEILGAGVLGGNLTATILYMGPDGMSAVLDTQAVTTVTSAGVQQSDALGSLVGFIDIQDDGSGIIGMLALEGYLVVYKDTSVFMGQFTGVAGAALDFSQQPPYRGDKTLYYRYTLISVNSQGQQFHLYAGRNSFYKFDLVTRRPVEVDTGELCKNLFFDNVDLPGILGVELVSQAQTYVTGEIPIPVSPGGSYYYTKGASDLFLQQGQEIIGTGQFIAKGTSVNLIGIPSFAVTASLRALNNINVFAADNPITKEVFFCFPTAPGVDKAMRYDYYTGQVSTTSAVYTAAAAVKRPVAGIQVGPSENWFVMGANDGTMLRYGLTNTRPFLNIGLASQSGNTVSAVGNPAPQLFTPELVIGRTIKFADGTFANVTGFIDPTRVTVGGPPMTRVSSLISVISASWHRLGQPYDSVMQAGLECFGTTFGEKTLESWLIVLASPSPGSTVRFDLLGATNPSPNPAVLGSRSVLAPLTKNAIGMNFIQNYFADRITVSGVNNPEEIIERVFNIAGIDSKAFTQR